jgi:hypothetical protein
MPFLFSLVFVYFLVLSRRHIEHPTLQILYAALDCCAGTREMVHAERKKIVENK